MNVMEEEVFKNLKFIGNKMVNIEYNNCIFNNCSFVDVEINNCKFIDCTFKNCKLNNIIFKHSSFKSGKFINSALIGINWNVITDENMLFAPIAEVSECLFKYNNFLSLKLNKLDFSNCKFQECFFENCSLAESKFNKSIFDKTSFSECNLIKTDFRNANGYIININNNKLKGSKFSFPEVVSLLNVLDIIID